MMSVESEEVSTWKLRIIDNKGDHAASFTLQGYRTVCIFWRGWRGGLDRTLESGNFNLCRRASTYTSPVWGVPVEDLISFIGRIKCTNLRFVRTNRLENKSISSVIQKCVSRQERSCYKRTTWVGLERRTLLFCLSFGGHPIIAGKKHIARTTVEKKARRGIEDGARIMILKYAELCRYIK